MPSKSVVELIKFADSLSNREMMKWALRAVREALDLLDPVLVKDQHYRLMVIETNNFLSGLRTVTHMRNEALKMHELARHEQDEIRLNLLRSYGHVIATAHVKEHALHAIEYAVKALQAAHIDETTIEDFIKTNNTALEALARFIISVD